MNSINDAIVESVIDFVSFALDRLTELDRKGRTLKLVNYNLIPIGDYNLGDLTSEGLTLESDLKLNISITGDDGITTTEEYSVEVPTMMNGVFVIEGKRRIATNELTNSSLCRLYPNKIMIDYEKWVDVDREHEFSPLYCTLGFRDLNGDITTVPATEENFEIYRNFLKLTKDEKYRLMIKLDVDDVGDYLTYDLTKVLFELGEDKFSDSIVDKKISAIDTDFYYYLNRSDAKWNIYQNISRTFWQNNYLSFNSLNSAIKKYFRIAQSGCIEIPSNINPLVYDALKYKVTLPANVMYNESFVDLIDASNTPENNNVNILNELNVATSIKDGVIYYKCYSYPDCKPMKLEYLEYLTKLVLKCDYYDYDDKKVKDVGGYVICRRRLKDVKLSVKDLDKIELIEPKPDERLSYTTRRIPLVNMSDSVRVSMGAAMIRQSIQTEGCEPRLVQSGNDEEDIKSSASLIAYNGINEGEVVKIEKGVIYIKDSVTNLIMSIKMPDPILGANQSTMTYSPIVKVGDKVKPGQIVTVPKIMKDDTYSLGINANAVYMNYLGYSFEDGVIVSESYAKKATHYSIISIQATVKSTDQIRSICKIGQKVKSPDVLVHSITTLQIHESYSNMLQSAKGNTVFKALEYNRNSRDILTPNNIDEGYVADVKIVFNKDKNAPSPTEFTQKVIDGWMKDNKVNDYDVLPEEYRRLSAPDSYDFRSEALVINIVIVRVDKLKVGDKSSNSWGGKGEISLILPDECMPRINDENGKPFDIIMNPGAVIARKNISQLYECLLTKCIREIYEIVQECLYVENPSHKDIEVAKKFTQKYYGDKFMKMADEEFLAASKSIFNFAMKVGSYAKIDYDTVLDWCKDLDVKPENYVFVPDVVIYEGPNGRTGCTPEYAKEHNIKGKLYELGFSEEPVVCGESYMYKLYHTASYSGKCTPEKSRRGDPYLGRGLFRPSGQKIGEMELWALSSYGATVLLTHDNKDIQKDQNAFIQQMLLAGLAVTDMYGMPFGSAAQKYMLTSEN